MIKKVLGATLALFVVAAAPRPAAAFEVVSASDVKSLAGKKVFVETPCSARGKSGKEVHLFVGQELTITGPGNIGAWARLKTAEGDAIELMIEHLSKTKPLYSQLDAGKLETFLPQVFAEAYDIPGQLADLWKKHDYDLDKDDAARDARTALENAFAYHKWLVGQLVNGRTSKSQVLGDEAYKWLWTADASIMSAFCEGMAYLPAYKKSEFFAKGEQARDLLNAVGGIAEAAGDIMMVKSELKRKSWLDGLSKDAPKAQKDALDKEETEERQKKLVQLEERLAKARTETAAERKALGY